MAGELLLGVDIGTYSAKGVLCTPTGDVLATETIEHEMSIPRPGWAEHDADTIWWGEFAEITRRLLSGKYSGEDVGGVAVSAIGACMLPIDDKGHPLRPGVLYGIDTRATAEIAWLNERFGEGPLFELGGMALTSQAIGPKILWLQRNEPAVLDDGDRATTRDAQRAITVDALDGCLTGHEAYALNAIAPASSGTRWLRRRQYTHHPQRVSVSTSPASRSRVT